MEQKSRRRVFNLFTNFLIYQLEPESTPSAENRLGVETKLMVYTVAFQRTDREVETLYWEGSLEETIGLARSVALECGFEEFRIIEWGGSGAKVFSEQLPAAKHR
jgi:hypothetical protein